MFLNKKYGEPTICILLMLLMVLEVPFFNIYLIAPILLFLYYTILMKKRLLIGIDDLFLVLFIISYFAIDKILEYTTYYKIAYAASMICSYLCGKRVSFAVGNGEINSLKMRSIIKFFAYSYFLYVVITMLYSVFKGQFLIMRNPLSIWTGEFRAATHFGTMLVIPLTYGIYLLVSTGEKIFGGSMIAICVAVSVMTASRTILYMIPIGIGICILLDAKFKNGISRRLVMTVIAIVVVCLSFVTMFYANVFGIYDFFLQTQLGQRIILGQTSSFKEDGRMIYNTFLFHHLGESFLGGGIPVCTQGDCTICF